AAGGARRAAHDQAHRGGRGHPRRDGIRRLHGECRARAGQERPGLPRGPDHDARADDQERSDHRREDEARSRRGGQPRDRRGRRAEREVRHRRIRGGVPGGGQDQQRVARRARAAGSPRERPAASDFSRYYASRFLDTFEGLGIRPEEIHWMRDLYRSGELDKQIDLVLRNAATIREIYARVANVKKDERWLPIGVICDNCRRLGTTYSYDYDGKTVAYDCLPDYVEWATGCGHSGRISPFKGNAKLYWNLT